MRSFRLVIAATIAAVAPSLLATGSAGAQETIVMDGAAMPGPDAGDCNCRDGQRPPWHGAVAAEACGCGPVCRVHGKFHADACGQLRTKWQVHHGHGGNVTMPPYFPRLHTWCAEGYLPTPPPLVMPRCHRCGAVIAGGF